MTPWPYPFWIAHRGAGKLAPENTLAALREGARHGFRAFECDVKLSADGVPFLLHDATLERTTDGAGPAAALDWSTLSRLDAGSWHGRSHAGEPPASLDAVARFVQANGFALNLELKPSPGHERRTGEVVAAWVAHRWDGAQRPPLLSSFKAEALEGARDAAPQVPRALLVDALGDGWLDRALALGCDAVVVLFSLLDASLVRRVHEAGLRVLAYTANDPATVQWLRGLHVDGIVTDAVDRFSPADER